MDLATSLHPIPPAAAAASAAGLTTALPGAFASRLSAMLTLQAGAPGTAAGLPAAAACLQVAALSPPGQESGRDDNPVPAPSSSPVANLAPLGLAAPCQATVPAAAAPPERRVASTRDRPDGGPPVAGLDGSADAGTGAPRAAVAAPDVLAAQEHADDIAPAAQTTAPPIQAALAGPVQDPASPVAGQSGDTMADPVVPVSRRQPTHPADTRRSGSRGAAPSTGAEPDVTAAPEPNPVATPPQQPAPELVKPAGETYESRRPAVADVVPTSATVIQDVPRRAVPLEAAQTAADQPVTRPATDIRAPSQPDTAPDGAPPLSNQAGPDPSAGPPSAPPPEPNHAVPAQSPARAETPATPAAQIAPALASLVQSPDGSRHVTLRLDPEALGHVRIEIDRPLAAPARVEITVEHEATLTLLLHDQTSLRNALDHAGVPSEGRELVFHLGPPEPSPAGANGSAGWGDAGASAGDTRSGGQEPSRQPARQETDPRGGAPDTASGPVPMLNRWRRLGLDITA